jgi:predicted dehydrogenase
LAITCSDLSVVEREGYDRTRSVLVVGSGSIGRRHLRNLRALGLERIEVCDPDPDRLSLVARDHDVKGHVDFETALDSVSPDAVLICTPPYLHVSQALTAIRHGAHAFVEKPLSHSMERVDELIEEADARGRIVQVGYHWRFDRGLHKIKAMLDTDTIGRVLWARAEYGSYMPDWRPDQDYRQSYSAHRSMGGGAILDNSHEIDYMLTLFGKVVQVYCLADVLSDLEVDAEDTASMVLRFASGSVGEIHLDFVQRVQARNCKIVGAEGTILWDHLEGSIRVSSPRDTQPRQFDVRGKPDDRYVAEIESFLRCIEGVHEPVVDIHSARRTLEVALAAHESARTQRAVNLS